MFRIKNRRNFIKAIGLGGLVAGYGFSRGLELASAQDPVAPKRVVFLVSSHGHVWNGWNMEMPGAPRDRVSARAFRDLDASDFSPTLRPLFPMRNRITAIEGLAHTSVLGEYARQANDGSTDFNNHTLSYAHLLTNAYAYQPGGGAYCRGGGRSIDQVLGDRSGGSGRFDSLTWDVEQDLPLRYHREYSYVAAGQPTPYESDPSRAYADLLGLYVPPAGELTRDDVIRASAVGALDSARESFDRIIPTLGIEGRRKLEQHRDLLADLSRSRAMGAPRLCNPAFEDRGHLTEQFIRLATMALACDMTRVVTLVMPILRAEDFGYGADKDVHVDFAHSSIEGGSSPFSMIGQQAMIDYNAWYAQRVADFLTQLDSIPEGEGTLLDNTAVVWMSELGTPTHEHRDVCTVLAGASGFFDQGRYVRYPRDIVGPAAWGVTTPFEGDPGMLGPSTSHLMVSLLRWMGQNDNSFGLESVMRQDGTTIDMTGPLSFLHT